MIFSSRHQKIGEKKLSIDMNDKIKIALYILLLVIIFCIMGGVQYPIGLLIYNLIFQSSPKSVSAAFFAGSIFELIIIVVAGISIIILRKIEMIEDLPDLEDDVDESV
jgi:hypothetical protein